MAVLSGKNGTIYLGADEMTPVAQWKLVVVSNNPEYVANDTAGWKQRVAGVCDSAGMFVVMADQAGHCPVSEGDSVTLNLHVDNSGVNYYGVPAIVDNIQVDVDISSGKVVAYVVTFSGNGAVTPNGIVAKAG
jgi:hypothetical protein